MATTTPSDAALISADRISRLLEHRSEHCLSMFMPTHRAGRDTRQDPIRFKNLIEQARNRLVDRGLRRPDAVAMLEPVAALHDDTDFWQHQADGLAVFCSPVVHEVFRLPLAFDDRVVAGERFHLKPIFPLLTGDGRFFVLEISQKQIRLLECTRDRCSRVVVPNMPTGREELMQFVEHEKSLQFHTGTGQVRTRSGERAAVFHGQGAVESDAKARIYEYFRQVDEALRPVLHDQRAPMLFAGVEYLFAIYREANRYPHLFDTPVAGNPDRLDDAEAHARAWEIIEPKMTEIRRTAAERVREACARGHGSTDIEAIVPAARHGRIDTLFVACDQSRWGRVNAESRKVDLHEEQQPGDEDLLDAATVHTFQHSGTVYAVRSPQMPTDSSIAALFRY